MPQPVNWDVLPIVSGLLCLGCLIHAYFRVQRMKNPNTVIGIFHPYANHGGGGERVLWLMISALLNEEKIGNKIQINVYTGDIHLTRATLIANAEVSYHHKFEHADFH